MKFLFNKYVNLFLFRLWGEPVNLREQHDALEFFNSLVDSLDEALKSLSQPCVLSKVLGGSFADQKICKDCPHRWVVLELKSSVVIHSMLFNFVFCLCVKLFLYNLKSLGVTLM